MPWPALRVPSTPVYATGINDIINALSSWGGDVSANGASLRGVNDVVTRGAVFFSSPNALGQDATWNEFAIAQAAGGTQAADLLVFYFNARNSVGAANDFRQAFSVRVSDGGVSFAAPASFFNPVSFATSVTFAAGNAVALAGPVTFAGSAVFNIAPTFAAGANFSAGAVSFAAAATFANDVTFSAGTIRFNAASLISNAPGVFNQPVTFANTINCSAGANFAGATFSAPQNIIFGSGYQAYTPSFSAVAGMTLTSIVINYAGYLRVGPFVHFSVEVSFVIGGSLSPAMGVGIPVPAVITAPVSAVLVTGSGATYALAAYVGNPEMGLLLPSGGNFPAGAATLRVNGVYRVA